MYARCVRNPIWALGVVGLLGLAASAGAQDAAKKMPSKIGGGCVSVDLEARTFTLGINKGEWTFRAPDDSRIFIQPLGKVEQLSEGDRTVVPGHMAEDGSTFVVDGSFFVYKVKAKPGDRLVKDRLIGDYTTQDGKPAIEVKGKTYLLDFKKKTGRFRLDATLDQLQKGFRVTVKKPAPVDGEYTCSSVYIYPKEPYKGEEDK